MILQLTAKCDDMCSVVVLDDNDNELLDYQGYVPDYIPNSWGDYVELNIDPETGQILNWDAGAVRKALGNKGSA